MQGLFSAFPAGRPGAGLLLLRLSLAGLLALHIQHTTFNQGHVACQAMLLGLAGLITIGLLIPLAAIAGAVAIATRIPCIAAVHSAADVAVMMALIALALIGGGACSIDARLYGRHEVTISDR